MSTWSKGDKVQFLLPSYTIHDEEGNNIHEKLKPGDIYTIKQVGIIAITLEEVEGSYLKDNFCKVRTYGCINYEQENM